MATQTEQATVHATEVESINNGVNPQRRVMPDSNSNALKIVPMFKIGSDG